MKKICSSLLLIGMGVFSGSLGAATVGAGTFNLSGTVVGSTTGLDFYFSSPGDETATINLPTNGAFNGLAAGTKETIKDLTTGNGVIPGTTFDFMNWIQLSDGINLDLTSVPLSSFPVCPASGAEAIGYQCVVNANSPVVLTQGINGVSARLNLSGDAHFAGSTTMTPFTALLNAPSTPYNTIAAFETAFDTSGVPSVSYAASFTTTAVPEPAALGLISIALLGFGLLKRRNSRA